MQASQSSVVFNHEEPASSLVPSTSRYAKKSVLCLVLPCTAVLPQNSPVATTMIVGRSSPKTQSRLWTSLTTARNSSRSSAELCLGFYSPDINKGATTPNNRLNQQLHSAFGRRTDRTEHVDSSCASQTQSAHAPTLCFPDPPAQRAAHTPAPGPGCLGGSPG